MTEEARTNVTIAVGVPRDANDGMKRNAAQKLALAKAVYEKRIMGDSLDEIAQTLKIPTAYAKYLYNKIADAYVQFLTDNVKHAQALDLARIDKMLQAILPLALGTGGDQDGPNLNAIDRVAKLLERRGKLLGLDVQKLEVSGPDGGPIQIQEDRRVLLTAMPVEKLMEMQKLLEDAESMKPEVLPAIEHAPHVLKRAFVDGVRKQVDIDREVAEEADVLLDGDGDDQ